MFVELRNNLRRDDELAMALDVVTTGGAKVLGLTGWTDAGVYMPVIVRN
jgi:cytosine/adenosine deaminase-related metal-dependent hydrolase